MKRTILAACILLSGCYVDPNTGVVYSAPQYYPQTYRQVYQAPPPNPYYQGRETMPEPYPTRPTYDPPLQSYNDCVGRAAYVGYREDCGAYVR